jgi:hypothetical protein
LSYSILVNANEAANFGLNYNASTSGLASTGYTSFSGGFMINGTSLDYTVAAVPEAETYAMMLAGLGLVGFMVRRRNAA